MKNDRPFLKKKRAEAVAFTYTPSVHEAPVVVAKGKGKIAENIISIANEHHIPVQKDPALIELCSQLHINETIPEQLFTAVAEIFAFIYKIDKEKGEKSRTTP